MSDQPRDPWEPASALEGGLGSGVDDFGPDSVDADHPFEVDPGERYRTDGTLGQGGMGVVEVVFDRRLRRQVARKKCASGAGPGAARRLAQEAWITAQLDHPGIIAVHDAGVGPHGELVYTMRMVRGQTFADACEQAEPGTRLELLRHLRDAAEAVGFAHQQGIVHRDIKPANIMVGAFGQTQVMDWGLARPVPGPEGDRWRALLPDDLRAQTRAGAVLGTPLYMSPEQASGEAVGAPSDVWSFGVLLYELLAGASPFAADSERRVLAAILTGSRPPLQQGPGRPAPLIAITDRALSQAPADRYPDAKALADDLTRWMEGRRVEAHHYTPAERLGRRLTALRVPLLVGGIALLVGFVATLTFAHRAREQAADAAEARRQAERAALLAETHLQQALVSRALSAFSEHDRGTAEFLAAHALVIGEDPDARGILAGFARQPRPQVLSELDGPACEHVALDPTGHHLACSQGTTVSLWTTAPLAELWRHEVGRAQGLSVTEDAQVVVQLDGATRIYTQQGSLSRTTEAMVRPRLGPDRSVVWSANRGIAAVGLPHPERYPPVGSDRPLVRLVEPCGQVLALEVDGWTSACVGRLVRWDGRERVERPLPSLAEIGDPTTLLTNEDSVIVGTLESSLLRIRWPSGERSWRLDLDLGAVVSMASTADGAHLAVLLERGGVLLLDAHTGRPLTHLPPQPRAHALGIDAENVLTVVGPQIRRIQLPAAGPTHAWPVPSGVNDLEMKPDGTELAAAYGGGWSRWSWPEGKLLSEQAASCVVRDLDWAPDATLVVALSTPDCLPGLTGGVLLHDGQITVPHNPPFGARRVAALGDDGVAFISYAASGPHTLRRSAGPAPAIAQPDGVPVSIENTPDADVVVWSGPQGLWRYALGEAAPTPAWDESNLGPVAVDPTGAWAVVASDEAVHRIDLTARTPTWSTPTPSVSPRDAAISPDGRWTAIAARDGTARVYDASDGRLRAVFRGHTEQVAAVSFGPHSRTLFTGGWDDIVRAWDVGLLDAEPEALLAEVADAWKLDLSTSLQGR